MIYCWCGAMCLSREDLMTHIRAIHPWQLDPKIGDGSIREVKMRVLREIEIVQAMRGEQA